MAKVVVTVKLMPESPGINLEDIQGTASDMIDSFTAMPGEKRYEIEPIAFGLKALKITFVMDESTGSTDALEADLARIGGVNSVDVIDVRRAIG